MHSESCCFFPKYVFNISISSTGIDLRKLYQEKNASVFTPTLDPKQISEAEGNERKECITYKALYN